MNSVLNVPRQTPYQRKKLIKKHIVSKDIDEIAKMCGVNEKTIDRDIAKMKESGEWHGWLELFLLKLYSSDDVSDDAKLRSVTMLYGKSMVQKSEIKTDGITRYEFVVVEPDGKDPSEVEPPPDTVDSPPE